MNQSLVEKGMQFILKGLGCDMKDRNFFGTPERYAKAMKDLFEPPDVDYQVFEESYNNFILLRGHRLWSLCPHHMLPVELRVDLAYIPNGEVLGLSKLARLCHDVNRGPLLQEFYTRQLVEKLKEEMVSVKGVACRVVGTHDCARIRGVHTSGSFTTYNFTGEFKNPDQERRFFELIR